MLKGYALALSVLVIVSTSCRMNDGNDANLASWENDDWLIGIRASSGTSDFEGTSYGDVIRFYSKVDGCLELVYENDFEKIKPWTVSAGDLEGDGILDVCIGAITETEFYPEEKRPFFFEWDGERLVRKWTGSHLGFNELVDLWIEDVDGDGIGEVVTVEKDEGGNEVHGVYRWGNFSFYMK